MSLGYFSVPSALVLPHAKTGKQQGETEIPEDFVSAWHPQGSGYHLLTLI